jgi:hypothetical protein
MVRPAGSLIDTPDTVMVTVPGATASNCTTAMEPDRFPWVPPANSDWMTTWSSADPISAVKLDAGVVAPIAFAGAANLQEARVHGDRERDPPDPRGRVDGDDQLVHLTRSDDRGYAEVYLYRRPRVDRKLR